MEIFVECVCGKKYEVDPEQVQTFPCDGCERELTLPSDSQNAKLTELRKQMATGEPGMKAGTKAAAQLKNFHAVPLLIQGAESGVREAVNSALVGLSDYPGVGREVLLDWIKKGRVSMSRLATAYRENEYSLGAEVLCDFIRNGKLRENEIAEVAGYLAESRSLVALETLRAARRSYSNLSGILDNALAQMKDIDESAGEIPDSAKTIPGRNKADEDQPKGCMGMLLLLALPVLAVVVWWLV